jgi:CYTH domain-containing protein
VRREYEYEIPFDHAEEMLADLCRTPLIEKTRHRVEHAGRFWQVDEFFGDNQGLVLAEIELADPDEPLERPSWLGDEVTGDPRYRNSFLARHPFRTWRTSARDALHETGRDAA